jgi:hypothetical protein
LHSIFCLLGLPLLEGASGALTEKREAVTKLRDMFRGFTANNDKVYDVPQYFCGATTLSSVAETYSQLHPKVNEPIFDPKKLQKLDFSRKRIDFILNPEKYRELLFKAGYTLKVVKGDARHYWSVCSFKNKSLV